MAKEPSGSVALMAIREPYVTRLLNGTKKVEFRKTAIRKPISHVVIYESRAEGKIVGYFEVAGITRAKPNALWDEYADVSGISEEDFFQYFSGTEEGTGIKVGGFYRLKDPIPVDGVNPAYKPPQSYFYLRREEFDRIKRKATVCAQHGTVRASRHP